MTGRDWYLGKFHNTTENLSFLGRKDFEICVERQNQTGYTDNKAYTVILVKWQLFGLLESSLLRQPWSNSQG